MMFESYPTYDWRRPQFLTSPPLDGADVFAFQTELAELGFDVTADGVFGQQSDTALRAAQAKWKLQVDGHAGPLTFRAAAVHLARRVQRSRGIIPGALRGQIELESGNYPGAVSPQRDDGSYDAGLVQTNTDVFPASVGFDPVQAVGKLADRVKRYYGFFEGIEDTRRWQLAQGAWNAPAFASWIAKREGATKVPGSELPRNDPSQQSIDTLELYMKYVSRYYA
jgi:peptidoglycan hydrolase-like protein with peptidoglycan-binding domain